MRHAEGQLSDRPLLDLLAGIWRARRSAKLSLQAGDRQEVLHFHRGDLYLPSGHPFAARLAAVDGDVADDRRRLAGELAAVWTGWGEGRYDLDEAGDLQPQQHAGPLPLGQVLMEAAVAHRDELQLRRQLGGEERIFVAVGGTRTSGLDLDTHEAFLLSRMERPAAVKELLRQVELEPGAALVRLCRLLAADLIRPSDEVADEAPGGRVSQELVRRFAERIATDLARKPLTVGVDEQRQQLKEQLAHLGERNHFELLGVPLGASPEEVYDAYARLARLVHPSHSERLGLAGRSGGLEVLFERATDAYLTLSDPERTRSYVERLGPGVVAKRFEPSERARKKEIKELAEHKYRLACNYAAREEYHFAVQVLEQAVEIDPQPEYYVLLGECQEHNPRWQERALQSFSTAVQLRRDAPELRTRLAQCYEKQGKVDRAREEYEAALERMPGFPDAQAGLKRLKRPAGAAGRTGKAASGDAASGGSLLDRLRGLFGG